MFRFFSFMLIFTFSQHLLASEEETKWEKETYSYRKGNGDRFNQSYYNRKEEEFNNEAQLMRGLHYLIIKNLKNDDSKKQELAKKNLLDSASGPSNVGVNMDNTCNDLACLFVSVCYKNGFCGFTENDEKSEKYLSKLLGYEDHKKTLITLLNDFNNYLTTKKKNEKKLNKNIYYDFEKIKIIINSVNIFPEKIENENINSYQISNIFSVLIKNKLEKYNEVIINNNKKRKNSKKFDEINIKNKHRAIDFSSYKLDKKFYEFEE